MLALPLIRSNVVKTFLLKTITLPIENLCYVFVAIETLCMEIEKQIFDAEAIKTLSLHK